MAELPSYPFERPEDGAAQEIVPGIVWLRMALPFALNHVNLWLLRDGDGWTAVDTGYNDDVTRSYWETVFGGVLEGRPITRLIVTHFHPDHLALAGWLIARWGCSLWMTYSEWTQAHLNRLGGATADVDARLRFYAANGIADESAVGYRMKRPDFSKIIMPLPDAVHRMVDGDTVPIDGRGWRVITGAGHSPEHAALWCEELNILISGDQVLPRITTNISLQSVEPEGDPLKLYLESLGKFRGVRADALVLPSHDRPFYGLHDRLDALAEHHEERLEAAYEACAVPCTGFDLIPALFKRKLDAHQMGFAIGEALSHANCLVGRGRLTRSHDADGLIRYRQA